MMCPKCLRVNTPEPNEEPQEPIVPETCGLSAFSIAFRNELNAEIHRILRTESINYVPLNLLNENQLYHITEQIDMFYRKHADMPILTETVTNIAKYFAENNIDSIDVTKQQIRTEIEKHLKDPLIRVTTPPKTTQQAYISDGGNNNAGACRI